MSPLDGSVATKSPGGVRGPVRRARPPGLRPDRGVRRRGRRKCSRRPRRPSPTRLVGRPLGGWTSPSSVRPVPDYPARTEKICVRTTSGHRRLSPAAAAGDRTHRLDGRAGCRATVTSAISTTRLFLRQRPAQGLHHHLNGGSNIVPEELEAVLESDPAVREAAVVALPDRRLGEVPVALVEADGDGDAITSRASERLSTPASVHGRGLHHQGTASAWQATTVDKPAHGLMAAESSTS